MRLLIVLLSFSYVLTLRADCVGPRWQIKVATDSDAASIDSLSMPTTIAFLHSLPSPRPLPYDRRVAPVEKTIYSIGATVIAYRVDERGDAQLILSDGEHRTLLAEIPSGACVNSSYLEVGITGARRLFDERFPNAQAHWQVTKKPIEVHGVAFFDFLQGQRGMAPNGLSLHPVTYFTFTPLLPVQQPSQPRRRAVAPHLPVDVCPIPSLMLTTDKTTACAQESVTLSWLASDPSARVTIDGARESLPASGSMSVSVSNSSIYSGRATNACGNSDESIAVVTLQGTGTASLSGPSKLEQGATGNLSIFLSNASSWSLSSELGNPLWPPSGFGSGTSSYIAIAKGVDLLTLNASGVCSAFTRSIVITDVKVPVDPPPPLALLCCDETRSPTCFDCKNQQGCCSSHGGVCDNRCQ